MWFVNQTQAKIMLCNCNCYVFLSIGQTQCVLFVFMYVKKFVTGSDLQYTKTIDWVT